MTLALLALAACSSGGAVLNPLNWFGDSRSTAVERALDGAAQAPVIDRVISLVVDPTPGGAIVSTVGLPPTQGFWQADLVPVPTGDPSALLFDFRILPPLERYPAGTQPSREVLAGTFTSNQDLRGVRTIAVQGALNRISVGR